MFLPHIIAFIIELKLSSSKIISLASLATYVPLKNYLIFIFIIPAIPMAKPTSALFNAGASFVPSPVTATIFPLSIKPTTNAYLSSGLDLDNTSNLFIILSNSFGLAIVSTLAYNKIRFFKFYKIIYIF